MLGEPVLNMPQAAETRMRTTRPDHRKRAGATVSPDWVVAVQIGGLGRLVHEKLPPT